MISSVVLLLAVFVSGAPMDDSECCEEKQVGDTFYTRLDDDDSFSGVPDQCLNDCLYTITGTSEPKFCFARGELPVECANSGYGLEFGSGSEVSISVVVRSATSNEDVADAFVEFTLGDLVLTNTTDQFGLGIVTFSLDDIVVPEDGLDVMVEISKENFITYSFEDLIYAEDIYSEQFDWQVAIALSPDLAENEMRIVLSWETSQDLDIYALQMEKETGAIVCKTYWKNQDGCEGITLDVDSRHGENGSETITWNEGAADPYMYLLYVNDYDEFGFSQSEGRISFYGENIVKMEVEDGNNEDRYWMLGSFEPSEGISSFTEDGWIQLDNPDTSILAREGKGEKKPDS